MQLAILNIKCLVQIEEVPRFVVKGSEMSHLTVMEDAYLLADNGLITAFGPMADIQAGSIDAETIIDATDRFVFPSYCDPHTHLVYAGSRENEFVSKIRGLSYRDIARQGGGIASSASLLHNTSEEELYTQTSSRVNEIISLGTGAVEIKSGYGLNLGDELKMLRVIRRIKENFPLEVRSTFLGAHALPPEFIDDREGYVDHVINEMIPVVAAEGLADFIDVFCDKGFFTAADTERILMAGLKYGLRGKIHTNELDHSGGIAAAVKYDALSADHLEFTDDDDINHLLNSSAMPTILPGTAFFLGIKNAPVRKMIDSGLAVAMASDYNPGSSPSGNMNFVMSLGCINLGMLPEEAINSVTINAAYAMGLSATHGSIARGKVANLFITREIPSYHYLPYAYGSNLIETIILKGKTFNTTLR